MNDNKILPPSITRSLRSIKAQIEQLTPDKDELTAQITLIKEATAAAESLPADLQMLIDARNKLSRLSDESIKLHSDIEKNKLSSDELQAAIQDKEKEAKQLISNCEEAYRITTTKGLAAGFDQRASALSKSMWIWVLGLLSALVSGAILGTSRITELSAALNKENQSIEIVIAHAILSILSIGAPLWFAWISSKQISQRFRLAEDYAFKASVAKAYEGYRKEAVKIDEAFVARLFSTALTRIEEEPLRLISEKDHSSPWQELISSKPFQEALDMIPELKEKFIEGGCRS